MNIGLFSSEGLSYLFRWFHYLAGVTWIGHLYYFNFVQGAFFAETDAATKTNATVKLVPRALWWFRWGAMLTFITGLLILMYKSHQGGMEIFYTSWGVFILIGALMGTIMFLNVWLVIWPNQQVVIASATQVAAGGKPLENAAACGAKGLLASRTNTLLSIPMLFFMGAASHLPHTFTKPSLMPMWIVVLLIILGLELNALKGKLGPLTTIRGVIHCGFALFVVLYGGVVALT